MSQDTNTIEVITSTLRISICKREVKKNIMKPINLR